MASPTIDQPGQQFVIAVCTITMTVQAPAHIHHLAWFRHGHLTQLTMAGFTIHTSGDVGTMIEVNKIRQDENRHPLYGFIIQYRILQFLLVFVLNGYLLVTAPALGLGGYASRAYFPSTWVAVEALHTKTDMDTVIKLNWLVGRLLGEPEAIGSRTQE
jgi:hypothetical protein